MVKTFCDICGNELTPLEEMNAYCVSIVSKNRMCYAPSTKKYPEVCESCAEKIIQFINKVKAEN